MVRGSIECLSTMQNPHGLMHRLVQEALAGNRRLFKWGVLDVLEPCNPDHTCRAADHPPALPPGAPPAADCPLLPECRGHAKIRREPGHISIDDALRMKRRVSLAVWQAEMLCLHPSRTSAVLPEFDPTVHVVRSMPPDHEIARWIGGVDFGFRAPTVVLWAAVDRALRIWVVDERIAAGVLLEDHIRAIKDAAWPLPDWFGVDPAGAAASSQTGLSDIARMRRAGLNVRRRGSRLKEGLALIRARLQPADNAGPRLFIHERCAGLIEAMTRYHYDPARPDRDIPVKDGHDHAVDALRYMILGLDAGADSAQEDY